MIEYDFINQRLLMSSNTKISYDEYVKVVLHEFNLDLDTRYIDYLNDMDKLNQKYCIPSETFIQFGFNTSDPHHMLWLKNMGFVSHIHYLPILIIIDNNLLPVYCYKFTTLAARMVLMRIPRYANYFAIYFSSRRYYDEYLVNNLDMI